MGAMARKVFNQQREVGFADFAREMSGGKTGVRGSLKMSPLKLSKAWEARKSSEAERKRVAAENAGAGVGMPDAGDSAAPAPAPIPGASALEAAEYSGKGEQRKRRATFSGISI